MRATLQSVVVISDLVPKIWNFANVYSVPGDDYLPRTSFPVSFSMYRTQQHELDDCIHDFISLTITACTRAISSGSSGGKLDASERDSASVTSASLPSLRAEIVRSSKGGNEIQ